MLGGVRVLLRPFALHAAYTPIGTIVFFCVIGTLAYFHILNGIKHSSFFAPSYPTTLRPAHARFRNGEWISVGKREWVDAWKHPEDGVKSTELQQIVFKLDDKRNQVSFGRTL